MDSPRLLLSPDRPHLLARCRAHQIHLTDGAGASAYPKVTFTIDLYIATSRRGSICRRISTDSKTIYGQRLFDWDCSFVDSDRIAIAYRDRYFGPKILCLLLYDISRRQFRSCCLTADDYDESEENGEARLRFQSGPYAARASAEEALADYMLKGAWLLIVSPPNSVTDYRNVTVYRLSWPLETSLTLTPLWEPRPEMRIRVRPPPDFRRRRFDSRATFLTSDYQLRIFDGEGVPVNSSIAYNRFFSVDLSRNHGSRPQDTTWTICATDPLFNSVPPISTAVSMKEVVYCPWTSNLYLWQSSIIWCLLAPATHSLAYPDKENRPIDWHWSTRDLSGSNGLQRPKMLSWPPPATSFAINSHGGIYELDNYDEDSGTPRFVGHIGSQNSFPTLTYLATLRILDSWRQHTLEEFFNKSMIQLRDQRYPYCLARLAFIKS